MIIRSITISKIGPFLETFTLPLDPRVTVLTGSNDVGKSCVLKALELAFNRQPIAQDEVNHDHLQAVGQWTADPNITVQVDLGLTNVSEAPGATVLDPKDNSVIQRKVAPDINGFDQFTRLKHHPNHRPSPPLPTVIRPKLEGALRSELNLRELKPLEQALLNAAFEGEYSFAKYEKLSDLQYTRRIKKAESVLNKLLARVLPRPGMIHFILQEIAGDRARLALLVRDRHDGTTPFGHRGEGVRRMVTLLAELITTAKSAHHRLVLLDEPENSLHADAQHLLREFLWAMTEDGRTQVVYATHSPAMINPLRPEQVCVLVRVAHNETATTKLMPRPTAHNFIGVRSTLGVSASDSLLYAPVTVVTEGETEIKNIYPLIKKLADAGKPGFEDAEKLLRLSTFIDGMGDSFELVCRIARAHSTRVVLFLDGDKRAEVARQKVEETLPGMPIIYTPDTTEFEQLVPAEVYVRAALTLVGLEFDPIFFEQLETWSGSNPRRARWAFSKRIEAWFRDSFDPPFQAKATVMAKAIELATPDEIVAEPIVQLLTAIRTELSGSSFD